jgi:hypothetical protein
MAGKLGDGAEFRSALLKLKYLTKILGQTSAASDFVTAKIFPMQP